MRIISRKKLIDFWKINPYSEQPLKAWYYETKKVKWRSPNELKKQIRSASIINKKRVVFNIKGNEYRLVVDIEYKIGLVFIIWIGTHKKYNKINVNRLEHVKTNKK